MREYYVSNNMKNIQKNRCPNCNSKNVAEILYGLPIYSKELEKKLEKGKIILGGCCITNNSPLFHCNDCSKEWGVFKL